MSFESHAVRLIKLILTAKLNRLPFSSIGATIGAETLSIIKGL